MTVRVLELLLANVLMLVLGCGLLPLLRLAQSRRELLTRAPLGYAVGLAATGIAAADLAVIDVPVGGILLPVLAASALAAGLRRVPGGGRPRRVRARELPALGLLAAMLVLALPAARLFAFKPLSNQDGWEIWGLRARALYEFGHPFSPVFTQLEYPGLQHPLLLPALEALDFRFMRSFDGTTVHLQLLGLALAFVGGAWVLLRGSVRPLLLAATLLAVVAAPAFFDQLQTNYADIPLAMFVALGVAALATWLRTEAAGMLPAAALFLAAGALTKNEGECFALTAFIAAAAVARRSQYRPLLLAAAAVLAADLPWRIWLQANHVKILEYSLSNLFDPSYLGANDGRVGPSARELLHQILRVPSWSYLVLLALLGLVGALILRRLRLAFFAAGWLALSFTGLLAIYWISTNTLASNLDNSSNRTIDSLVITAALLVPVLLYAEPREQPATGSA